MGLGERKNPFSASDLREVPLNVEGLNDARTLLAGFFSILLAWRFWSMWVRWRLGGEPFA